MNFCILYATIWTIELLLYLLGWSDINQPLTPGVLILIVSTILLSLIWGIKNRDLFQFRSLDEIDGLFEKDYSDRLSLMIIILIYLISFVYCRQIPLLQVLLKKGDYNSFTGLPIVYLLGATYATYYSFKSYYLYEATENKQFLFKTVVVVVLHILVFSRVSLMLLLFEVIVLKIAKMGGLRKIFNPKRFVIFFVILVLALYLFGVLGNIRCGCKWNDCSVINSIGQFNDSYPAFLPDQFKWAYTYITSPLANLNNGIIKNGVGLDVGNYLASYVPDFLSKRLFPNYLSLIPDSRSVLDLNAVSGYYYFYYFGGCFGAIMMFVVLAGGPIWALKHLHFREEHYFAFLMISSELVSFLFFYNVIYLSQCSFCLIYPLFALIFKKKSENVLDIFVNVD